MRPIKILHTADVHLGAKFAFLGKRGGEHRRQLLSTFSKTMDLARTSQVDFILIAGDLFDSNHPPRAALEEVVEELRRVGEEGIEVLLAPGTHDRLGRDCVYNEDAWDSLPHLHVFRQEGWGEKRMENRGVAFYGWGYAGRAGRDPLTLLPGAEGDEEVWRVGLLHGSLLRPGLIDQEEVGFTPGSLTASGLDYLALGHWHSFQDLSAGGTTCAYPGSPEALYPGADSGKVALVTLGGGEPEIRSIQVGRRTFARREVDMSTVTDRNALKALIRRWADKDTWVEVVLKGVSLCDDLVGARDLEEELSPSFYGIRLRDESYLASLKEARGMPGGIVSGEFVKIAEAEAAGLAGEEKRAAEEALRLGLAYLEGRARR